MTAAAGKPHTWTPVCTPPPLRRNAQQARRRPPPTHVAPSRSWAPRPTQRALAPVRVGEPSVTHCSPPSKPDNSMRSAPTAPCTRVSHAAAPCLCTTHTSAQCAAPAAAPRLPHPGAPLASTSCTGAAPRTSAHAATGPRCALVARATPAKGRSPEHSSPSGPRHPPEPHLCSTPLNPRPAPAPGQAPPPRCPPAPHCLPCLAGLACTQASACCVLTSHAWQPLARVGALCGRRGVSAARGWPQQRSRLWWVRLCGRLAVLLVGPCNVGGVGYWSQPWPKAAQRPARQLVARRCSASRRHTVWSPAALLRTRQQRRLSPACTRRWALRCSLGPSV